MRRTFRILKAGIVLTVLLTLPYPVLSHGGDGHGFEGTRPQNAPTVSRVEVTPEVQKALGLKVTPVEEKTLADALLANGRIEAIPAQSAQVNAPAAGRIVRLSAAAGQNVRAGQPVAVLDSPEIRALVVEAERTRVEARAQVAQIQARVRLARAAYERERELVELKISARKDFQVAEAELAQAEGELRAARSRLDLSGAALSSRLAGLGQRSAKANADGSVVLFAPITGTVARQEAAAGEAVEAGKVLFEVVGLGRVWAVAQVYEKDLRSVRVGQAVAVRTESYPDRVFAGRITSIDPTVDPETRTLAVRAVLDNPGSLLKPGMFASLGLSTSKGAGMVPVILRSAVVEADGKTLVYVQNGGAFEPVEVELGRTVGNLVEVKDGVFPGDLVVTERAFQLRAQSLKGDFAAEESAAGSLKPDQPGADRATAGAPANGATALPGWAWALGAVAFSALAFFAGTRFTGQGNRETADADANTRNYLKPRR